MATEDFVKDFTAIDVELANRQYCSVCELGLARYRDGVLVETWRALINPEEKFESLYHSRLHGIGVNHVRGAPTFPEIYPVLKRFIDREVCIYHAEGGFDKSCITEACTKYSLDDLTASSAWASTLRIARRHWPNEDSYTLEQLCKKIKYPYHANNALEDAMAAAALYGSMSGSAAVSAVTPVGGDSGRPRTFRRVPSLKHKTGLRGNPEGPFYKTHIVLTGVFSPPWDDREAFQLYLDDLGFVFRNSISGKTEILVAGENPGPSKTAKAEQNNIRIMAEKEFLAYIATKNG